MHAEVSFIGSFVDPLDCGGTIHIDAREGSGLLEIIKRHHSHVLVITTCQNVVTEHTSHTYAFVLLFLLSNFEIGHVVLYVLHIIRCVLIRLISNHHMVHKLLLC